MRSFTNTPGIALVALLGMLLTGCAASANAAAFDSSEVPCASVKAELASSKEDLNEAEAELDDAAGTPAEVDANDAVTEAQAKVDALKERSIECVKEAKAEAEAKVDAAALAQCRVDAITARMVLIGFNDDEYVVGEDRINTTLPAFNKAGALAFDNSVIATREELAQVFTSDEPALVAVVDSKVAQFADQYDRKVVLNPDNWEIVQYTIPTIVTGNTGLLGKNVVSAGNTTSAAGDAEWLFIDPAKCVVPTANFDSMGNPVDPNTPEAKKPVGSIRPGCTNPNDGLTPKDPSEDILANPNVPSFYVPDEERQVANQDNYQGNLADVLAAQQAAAAAAAAEAARLAAIAEAARLAAEAEVAPEPPTGSTPQPGW